MSKEVNASIITIGDELLIGQTIDTNSAFIAQELNKIGIWVKRRIAISDVKHEIINALKEQSKDCSIIIITGGLGPTADDITKPALSEYFNAKMVINESALQNVKNIFTKLKRPLLERNLKQAEVPDNCLVLENKRGTAPGMWFQHSGPHRSISTEVIPIYISLPGVPNEMQGLMTQSVIPKLKETLKLPVIVHRTLLTSGVGESTIADAIIDFETNLPPHIKLAYLPAYGLVRLRLTSRSDNVADTENELVNYFEQLKSLVNQWMVADEDISLAEAVSKLLRLKNRTVSTAESCTGGYIAHLITSKAGSSSIYNGSVISYANDTKKKILGVKDETLSNFGAVSEQTVQEMARGVLSTMQTDYAIATSGIMGPDGGSDEKPVGTVWIAVANNKQVKSEKVFFRFDRTRNIEMAAHTALTMLYRFINEQEKE